MTDLPARPGVVPWPPVIYILATALAVILGLLYPLSSISDVLADSLLGDILFAIGWVMLLAVMSSAGSRSIWMNRSTMPCAEAVAAGEPGSCRLPSLRSRGA